MSQNAHAENNSILNKTGNSGPTTVVKNKKFQSHRYSSGEESPHSNASNQEGFDTAFHQQLWSKQPIELDKRS